MVNKLIESRIWNKILFIFVILGIFLLIGSIQFTSSYNYYELFDTRNKYTMTQNKIIYLCNKTIDENMKNIQNKLTQMNPEYTTEAYDNKMCEKYLDKTYGKKYVDMFHFLKDGPIKADFWRLCILYERGGIYSDIDNNFKIPFSQFIDPSAELVTCSSYWDKYLFNPNFIVVTKPKHPVLKRCIDWYFAKLEKGEEYDYWKWSIMDAFSKSLNIPNYKKEDGIYKTKNDGIIQIIKEIQGDKKENDYNTYKGVRVFNNRVDNWDHINHKFID